MDGKTRVCGLIANPVEHSMSPLMQNFYAERTGVNLAYVPFKVEDDKVGGDKGVNKVYQGRQPCAALGITTKPDKVSGERARTDK